MAQNLVKLSVGTADIADKHRWQSANSFLYGKKIATSCWTKRRPVQYQSMLESGASIYWVIKGHILCRQQILGFEPFAQGSEDSSWQIVLDPQLIRTAAAPRRAFQGWRYLESKDTPPDIGPYKPGETGGEEEIDPKMLSELRNLGLI